MQNAETSLRCRDILIVEDEYVIAQDLADFFAAEGATILGPAGSLRQAQDLIGSTGHIDLGLIDIKLRGEMAYPLADTLMQRRVPILFLTGYDARTIPAEYRDIPRIEKPVSLLVIRDRMTRLLSETA